MNGNWNSTSLNNWIHCPEFESNEQKMHFQKKSHEKKYDKNCQHLVEINERDQWMNRHLSALIIIKTLWPSNRFLIFSMFMGGWRTTRFRVSFAIIVQWISTNLPRIVHLRFAEVVRGTRVCVCVLDYMASHSTESVYFLRTYPCFRSVAGGLYRTLTLIQFTLVGCHSNLCTSLAALPLTSICKRVCLLPTPPPPPPSSRFASVAIVVAHHFPGHATTRPEIRPNFLPITFVVSIYFSSMRFGAQRYFTLWLFLCMQ